MRNFKIASVFTKYEKLKMFKNLDLLLSYRDEIAGQREVCCIGLFEGDTDNNIWNYIEETNTTPNKYFWNEEGYLFQYID